MTPRSRPASTGLSQRVSTATPTSAPPPPLPLPALVVTAPTRRHHRCHTCCRSGASAGPAHPHGALQDAQPRRVCRGQRLRVDRQGGQRVPRLGARRRRAGHQGLQDRHPCLQGQGQARWARGRGHGRWSACLGLLLAIQLPFERKRTGRPLSAASPSHHTTPHPCSDVLSPSPPPPPAGTSWATRASSATASPTPAKWSSCGRRRRCATWRACTPPASTAPSPCSCACTSWVSLGGPGAKRAPCERASMPARGRHCVGCVGYECSE